ncbi:MAG: hypothetical protein ACI8TX_002639, partial [Hyphomicrobiaceae bacterium]
ARKINDSKVHACGEGATTERAAMEKVSAQSWSPRPVL